MANENTDESRTDQRTALLITFGGMFTTVGVAIGATDSYGTLSFIFLGLGVVLSLVAFVLAVEQDDAVDEKV